MSSEQMVVPNVFAIDQNIGGKRLRAIDNEDERERVKFAMEVQQATELVRRQ